MKLLFALLAIFALVFVVRSQVDKSVCSLPKEIGPCRATDPSYFHNSSTKQCELFLYGGCKGNGNRFETKEKCENTCL